MRSHLYFSMLKAWEANEQAGVGGPFQIVSLEIVELEIGKRMAVCIDEGRHWLSDCELRSYLADCYKVTESEIHIEDVTGG